MMRIENNVYSVILSGVALLQIYKECNRRDLKSEASIPVYLFGVRPVALVYNQPEHNFLRTAPSFSFVRIQLRVRWSFQVDEILCFFIDCLLGRTWSSVCFFLGFHKPNGPVLEPRYWPYTLVCADVNTIRQPGPRLIARLRRSLRGC